MYRYFIAFEYVERAHATWGPQHRKCSVIKDLRSPIERTEDLRDVEDGLSAVYGKRVTIVTLNQLEATP